MVQCPRCGLSTPELVNIDAQLIEKLKGAGYAEPPSQVCGNCIADYGRSLNRESSGGPMGGVLANQERAKEQHRMQLWRSRVGLIKRARAMMSDKHYSEAAISYEKYIKILEMVFGCKKGEKLTPEMFKDNARTSELTVVTSVYWDLLRIYDTGDSYQERQNVAAKQLAAFVKFTPIFPDIIKKAKIFVKQARNPGVVKAFLKASSEENARCFIATSAFGLYSPEVSLLRFWRDHYLVNYIGGKKIIRVYEFVSPTIATLLDKVTFLKPPVRAILRIFVKFLFRR